MITAVQKGVDRFMMEPDRNAVSDVYDCTGNRRLQSKSEENNPENCLTDADAMQSSRRQSTRGFADYRTACTTAASDSTRKLTLFDVVSLLSIGTRVSAAEQRQRIIDMLPK